MHSEQFNEIIELGYEDTDLDLHVDRSKHLIVSSSLIMYISMLLSSQMNDTIINVAFTHVTDSLFFRIYNRALALDGVNLIEYSKEYKLLVYYDHVQSKLVFCSSHIFILGNTVTFDHFNIKLDTLDIRDLHSEFTKNMGELFRYVRVNKVLGDIRTDSLREANDMFKSAEVPDDINIYKLSKKVRFSSMVNGTKFKYTLNLNNVYKIEDSYSLSIGSGNVIGTGIDFRADRLLIDSANTCDTELIDLEECKIKGIDIMYSFSTCHINRFIFRDSIIDGANFHSSFNECYIDVMDLSNSKINISSIRNALIGLHINKLILNGTHINGLSKFNLGLSINVIEKDDRTSKELLHYID